MPIARVSNSTNATSSGCDVKSYLLQDWITISSDATVTTTNVAQVSDLWLDIGRASDLVFFLQIAQRTGGSVPKLRYETAPLRDSNLFQELGAATVASTPTTTVTPVSLYTSPAVPPSRWLRWRLTTNDVSPTWNVTFRLTVMAYAR